MKTPEQDKGCAASQMAEEWADGESDLWFADISTYTDGHKDAVKQGFLAGYQAAQPQWISVKDRLPDVGKEILWYHEPGNEFSVGLLHHGVEEPFFTHWMPLPKPPEEK